MSIMRRYSKGSRPQFFQDPAMDEAMSMIMVLASEVSVLRDRLDTFERLSAAGGGPTSEDIEQFVPDDSCLNEREAARQAFLQRLYFVSNKRAQETAESDNPERYQSVLDEISS